MSAVDAVTFRMPASPGAARSLRFACSPLLEAILSLHVLAGPEHHPVQHPWVRAARDLPLPLRRRMQAFDFAWQRSYPCCVFPRPDAGMGDFDAELERLQRLDPSLVAFEFGGVLAGPHASADPAAYVADELRANMRATALGWDGERQRLALLLLEDPASFLQELALFLGDYWQQAFAAEWDTIAASLRQAVVDEHARIREHGLEAFLEQFASHVTCRDGTVVVRAAGRANVQVGERNPLVLCPSIFIWPHVGVNYHEPNTCGLVYPAPLAREQASPRRPDEALLASLRALADESRLRILRLAGERPRTTQELAALLPMGEAGLSKHLRVLTRAGLVRSQRRGWYVLYETCPGAVAAARSSLDAYLLQGALD